jgi:hypothetical protein
MADHPRLFDRVETFQNMLISFATNGTAENDEYKALRQELLDEPLIAEKLPRFVRTCRDLGQFWQFIKHKFSTYQERREYLWSEFHSALEFLEEQSKHQASEHVIDTLQKLNAEAVQSAWKRALDRRTSDPEGAITAARTLLETVCKHILDDENVVYADDADLPKLYRLTSEVLNIAPSQHTEQIFKQILGGCTAVVEGLGSLRNRIGDAHGQGRKAMKPAARHAQLAVNLSGAMATFLVATWEARKTSNM